ncbi:hypothetical protein ABZ639_26750 [Saccharomonospora sp. NPDC006951]
MNTDWKYFGYDINQLHRNMSGEGIPSYAGVPVTYSGYWNQGKPLDQQSSPPYLAEDAQTPAPGDAPDSLTIEVINDQIMGEQPGTTWDRATQWFNIQGMLFHVQNDLFNQTDALEAEWESPAAKEAFLLKVGSTLAHIEVWREAAEANHIGLSRLAGAMTTAQTKMRELWGRYQRALADATEGPLGDPYADQGRRDRVRASPSDSILGNEHKASNVRYRYDQEARELISETADSYADAISKLETARANRMRPMNAILHPEAAGMELPPMPPGGGPGAPGGPGAFGGTPPTTPGGAPPAPGFTGAPPPPVFAGPRPPGGTPRADSAPAPAGPAATPRMPPATPVAGPPNAPAAGTAGAAPRAPGAAPPVAPGATGLRRPGAPAAQAPGSAPAPGRGLGTPPPPGAGGLPGKTPPPGSGMPGRVMPPPAGGVPQKPKQGKVLGDKNNTPAPPGTGQRGTPPPATAAPPARHNNTPGSTGRLETQDAFRPPPPPASPVLDTSKKKRRKAPAAEQDRVPPPPGAAPSVLSARVEPKSKRATKNRRNRPATENAAVPGEFLKGVDTGTAPVFEGRLASEKEQNNRQPLGDVPAALRGPAAASLDEHQRHSAPQADRTTRSAQRSTTDSWEVDTPGGPVVSSTKQDQYRAEPKKILGTKQQ